MLSKNNFKKRLAETAPRQERYSIRKFSVGAASVLIGFSLLGMSPTQTVRADSTSKTETSTATVPSNVTKSSDEQVPAKELHMNSNIDQQPADKAQENAATVTVEDSVRSAKEGPKKGDTKHLVNDSQQVAQKSTPAKLAKKTTSAETTIADKEELSTIDSLVKEYKALEEQTKSGKLNETDRQKAAEKLQEEMANLSPADQLKLATLITPVTTPRSDDVSDWSSLIRDAEDEGVGTINITNDITVYGSSDLTSIGTNGLLLNRPGIARDLTINGNGHNIDFGQYYVKLGNDTQTSDHPNWNITFRDINSRAYQLPGSAQYAPLYLGQVNSGTGDDAAVSADNQKNITITFDAVTAIADGRYGIISGHQDGDGPVDVSGEYYHLILTGNTNIQNDGVTTGSRPGDDGDAVSAGYVTVEGTGQVSITQNHTSSYNLQQGGAVIRVAQPDLVSGGTVSQYSFDVKQGAILHLNGARDVKGIVIADGKTGTANIDGEVQLNCLDLYSPNSGHSIAILAGNLNVGQKGWLVIQSSQMQTGDRTLDNLDSGKYGILSIGVGFPGDTTNAAANTINDNGDIEITRTVRDSTMSPMISMGSDATGGIFTINVNQGATLDLQDNVKQTDLGMIYIAGENSKATINFNSPQYVNLQRKNNLPTNGSDLIYIESKDNKVKINNTPIAQWNSGNLPVAPNDGTPNYVWIIDTASSMNNYGANAGTGFTAAGQVLPGNVNGESNFGDSNGKVIMNVVQSGKDQYAYDGSLPEGARIKKGMPGANYYTPYLKQFLEHFSYWTPQRLVIGNQVFSSLITNSNNLRNQPIVKTIDATTNQALNDLDLGNKRNYFKPLIDSLIRSTAQDKYGNSEYSASKVRYFYYYYIDSIDWYNPTTDHDDWVKQMGDYPEPNNPTDMLTVSDTHAWAKVTYKNGTIDFIDIPLNVTDPNSATLTIKYVDGDGTPLKTRDGRDQIDLSFNKNDGLADDDIKTAIDSNIPTNWRLASGFTYPGKQIESKSINVPLVHATKAIHATDPDVDPTDAKYQDLFKVAHRKIYQTKPGQTELLLDTQIVQFGRDGVEDLVTGEVTGTCTWQAGKIQNNRFVLAGNDEFPEYAVPQLSNFDSYVDGQRKTSKEAETALVNGEPTDAADVHITYTSHSGGGEVTPPSPGNDGDHNNPGDTPDNDHGQPEKPGDHDNNEAPVDPGHNGNNKTNPSEINPGTRPNNDNHSSAHGSHYIGSISRAQGKAPAKREPNALPQTGATNTLGILGLAVASLGALLGLGLNKKRRN